MMKKIIQKYFERVFWGPQNPLFYHFRGFWGTPKPPLKIFLGFFFTSYHIVWTLSFPGIPYFLFYNGFKRFYETFKKIGKNLGILHSKICLKSDFWRLPEVPDVEELEL